MSFSIKNSHTERPTKIWPDGWFLYQDDAIRGPFTTEEAFSEDNAGRTLISRKGFSRWYRLDELKVIHSQAEGMGLDVEDTTRIAQEKFSTEISKLAELEKSASQKIEKKVSQKIIEKPESKKKSAGPHSVPAHPKAKPASPTTKKLKAKKKPDKIEPAAQKKTKPQVTAPPLNNVKKAKTKKFEKKALAKKNTQTKKVEAKKPAANTSKNIDTKRDIAYHHLQLAGRLRLGKLKAPIDESLTKMIMTLGFYWGTWLRSSVAAVQWHMRNPAIPSIKFGWMAYIPGLHVASAHALAQKIIAMEKQNGYRKTSSWVATLLSVIPPLGMYYMQDKLNKHWALHIHSVLSKRAESTKNTPTVPNVETKSQKNKIFHPAKRAKSKARPAGKA